MKRNTIALLFVIVMGCITVGAYILGGIFLGTISNHTGEPATSAAMFMFFWSCVSGITTAMTICDLKREHNG